MSGLSELQSYNNEELVIFLEKNGLGEFSDVIRAKAYDGSELLNLKEYEIQLWRSKKTKEEINNFWKFLVDLKTNPEKYFSEEDDDEIYENYKEEHENKANIFKQQVSTLCNDEHFINRLKSALQQKEDLVSDDSFQSDEDELYVNEQTVESYVSENQPSPVVPKKDNSNVVPPLPSKPSVYPKSQPNIYPKPQTSVSPKSQPTISPPKPPPSLPPVSKPTVSSKSKPKSSEPAKPAKKPIIAFSFAQQIEASLKKIGFKQEPKPELPAKPPVVNRDEVPKSKIVLQPSEDADDEDEENMPEYLDIDDEEGSVDLPIPVPLPRVAEEPPKRKFSDDTVKTRPLPPLPPLPVEEPSESVQMRRKEVPKKKSDSSSIIQTLPLPPVPNPSTLPRPPMALIDLGNISNGDIKEIEDFNFEQNFVSKYSKAPFYRYTDREGSEKLLLQPHLKNGTFLIRPSTNHYCTVSVKYNNKVYQLALHKGEGTTVVQAGLQYDSVEAYIELYRNEPLCLPHKEGYVNIYLTDTLPPDFT